MAILPTRRSNWIPSLNIAKQIAGFEGGASGDGKYRPYWDSAGGLWTQGYGHTENVKANSRAWSRARAQIVLMRDLNSARYGGAVRKRLRELELKVSRKQFSALLDTVYNAGPGTISDDWRLGRALASYAKGSPRTIVADALRSTAVTGAATGPKPLAGLVRRRDKAARLWMGSDYWYGG